MSFTTFISTTNSFIFKTITLVSEYLFFKPLLFLVASNLNIDRYGCSKTVCNSVDAKKLNLFRHPRLDTRTYALSSE